MKTLVTLTLVLAFSALTVMAADNPVSGTWKVNGDIAGNAVDQVCTMKQDGKKLTGSCKSPDATTEITGEVNDTKVTWQFPLDYNGQKLTLIFTGTLDAASSQIKGTIDVQPIGVSGDFTAKKEEAKKEEPKKEQ